MPITQKRVLAKSTKLSLCLLSLTSAAFYGLVLFAAVVEFTSVALIVVLSVVEFPVEISGGLKGGSSTEGIDGFGGNVFLSGVTATASDPGAVVVLVKLIARIC